MFTNYYKNHLLFLLIIFIGFNGFSQLSKTHYIPPLTSAEFGNANPENQYIYLSTPSTSNVSYTIIPVGQPTTSNITGIVSNTSPQEIFVGSGNGQLFIPSTSTSRVINNRGYIIEAEDLVYVSIRMEAGGGAQAGALVSKGVSALDSTFRIGTYTNVTPQNNYLSFVSVMATEDDTAVTFSNLPPDIDIKAYTGPIPFTITLDEGESYTVAINSDEQSNINNRDGLIGALVASNKNIVVNCGSANGSFSNGGGRDYGIDQIAGLSKIGKEYIFVRGDGANSWENALIIAHYDNTAIYVNGNTTPIATINTGEYYAIQGNMYNSNGNMYVETSQDVFAYQGIGGLNNGAPSEANQGMFFVPPLSCEARGNIDNIASIEDIGNTTYSGGVTIVTKVGATVTVSSETQTYAIGSPSAVTGKPDYVTYKLTNLTGNISVQSSDELYCAYFNYNGAATSGSFYSGFPSPPEINFDAQFVTLGNCIPNVTLSAANTDSFDTYEWFRDVGLGLGFETTGISTPDITPTIPGKYKLIGVITCSGLTLESVEVPVSLCPDDIDNDGIIDNIDIDNDNDGILNCTESKGDVTINIANTNTPQLIFQDASTNNSITSGSFTQTSSSGGTNSISGDNTGNFTSTVSPANDAEGNYTLSFTELINFKFSENLIVPHVNTDGEFFIAKISPVNKNITLVDPDNRLLVDTNFDGVFETGVIMASGSEIHFKINPAPTGNTPYQFLANQVDGFSFVHRLANTTETSTFNGNLSLTCFKNDNDNDGIKDDIDLDSDNDGIPDFIENTGTILTLSGIDIDSNGLDDVYDINSTPIDSDTDGVLDFYDLDSDNDGIYDLVETGQLGITLSDTDLNGIEDSPAFGTNGWVDTAETTPDSGVIGYTISDIDTDTIFNYLDSDSDGDLCSDVLEAGFSDTNGDDYLGDGIVTVDTNGLVTSAADGYSLPNSDYSTAAPIDITTQPTDTIVCEASDTTISIVITAFDSIQWEVSTDGINWLIIIDGPLYSGSQTTDLTITAAPITINDNQYRALLNRNGNSCDFYSDEIDLTVSDLPIANTAPTMRLCDDDNNGTASFDLTLQNAIINTIADRTITYHASQAEANAGTPIITGPFESGNTTIFARVENDDNTTCFATSSFDLEVYETPFPLLFPNVTPIQECDNTTVGTDIDGFIVFDLTQRETEILNGQSTSDFTLTYFRDASALPASQIPSPTAFTNTTSSGQTIYVRVTNNLNSTCFADTAFEIEIYELPQVSNPNIYTQCDDDSNDGQAFFNLTLDSIKAEINPNYAAEGLTFTYYDDVNEANTNGVTIPDPANYQDALGFVTETVFIRIENPNGCSRVVPLSLAVSPSSAALGLYNPTSIYQCDDGTDVRDGVSTFNMTDIGNHISTVIFSAFNSTVHFYESLNDAELETNEIADISDHQNTNYPNSQSIWVRVKSDLGNNCLGLEEFPNLLIVEALPTANPVNITRVCDFDTSDSILSYPFDTSLLETNILNGQNPADVTITYFDSNGDPLLYSDSTTPVTSPIQSVFLTENQTITITVTNNFTLDADGPCSDTTTLDFIIDEQPIANPITIAPVCDGSAGDVDDDGLYPFNLATVQSTILGMQRGMEIYFNYIDETGSSITNSTTLPNTLISEDQTITIEVINPINTSCTANTSFDLIVNPLPDFSVDTPRIVCTSDPTFSIDLDVDKASVIDFFDYEWRWTSLDGTTTDQFISNDETIPVSTPGTYSITLTKTDGTGCTRTRDIFVDASEKATITIEDVTIIDISKNNSVTIDTANLGSGNYEYALREEGSPFITYQDEPVFENVRPGFYTIYVNDEICGFSKLDISVIGHAKYFTPNGDGTNDFWQIKGIDASIQPNSNIIIYDRYGKLLKQVSPLSSGWDGTFNGEQMPSDDYWFRVMLQDGREFMGHFTLKR